MVFLISERVGTNSEMWFKLDVWVVSSLSTNEARSMPFEFAADKSAVRGM